MKLNFRCCECVQNSLSATKKCSSKSIEIDPFLAYVVHYVRTFFECSINKSFFNVAGNIVHFSRLWPKAKHSISRFIT